jgi:hypothetical protein
VALRLVSRILLARKINLSDSVMFVGWALVCALSVASFNAANGLGVREGVRPERKQPLAKAQYAFTVLYVGCRTDLVEPADCDLESCVDSRQIIHSHLLPRSQ